MSDEPARKRHKRVIVDSDEDDEDDEPQQVDPPERPLTAEPQSEEEEEEPSTERAADDASAASPSKPASPAKEPDGTAREGEDEPVPKEEEDVKAEESGSENDDDDEEEDDSDDSGDSGGADEDGDGSSRKRRKRSQELELDSDDERLIEENTGVAIERKARDGGLRRLSHSRREPREEHITGETAEELQARLFGEGEGDDNDDATRADDQEGAPEKEEEVRDDEEEDDFIVDAEGRAIRSRRKGKGEGVSAERMEQMEEADAIFGTDVEMRELLEATGGLDDGGEAEDEDEDEGIESFDEESEDDDDFIELDEEERREREQRRQEKEAAKAQRRAKKAGKGSDAAARRAAKLKSLYEPETFAKLMLTDEDEAARQLDVPERMQPDFAEGAEPVEGELRKEAEWCYDVLFADADLNVDEASATNLANRRIDALESVLTYMRTGEPPSTEQLSGNTENDPPSHVVFELAFIRYFRKEAWAVGAGTSATSGSAETLLSEAHLRALPELHARFTQLQLGKASILERVGRHLVPSDSRHEEYLDALRRCRTIEDMSDVSGHVRLHVEEIERRDGRGGRTLPSGNRRPTPRGLLGTALASRLDAASEWFGISVDDLVENVCVHARQNHVPLDEMEAPLALAATFIESEEGSRSLTAELRQPHVALKAATETYAQQLAMHPELRRRIRAHLAANAIFKITATQRGKVEIDPSHPYRRVAVLHAASPPVLLCDVRPGYHPTGPLNEDTRRKATEAAELLLLAHKAVKDGFVKLEVVPPPVESDQLLKLLRTCFMSETSDATGSAWNEQREIIIHRALTGVAYQQITSELLEAATREAHATLSLHCASALRGMLIAPPFRAHDPYANQTGETDQEAIDKGRRRKKKNRDAEADSWRPTRGPFYPRHARIVGANFGFIRPPEGQRGKEEAVVQLVAVDEHGEVLDRITARWLDKNISARANPGPETVRKKIDELQRLEAFFEDTGCEAVVLGATEMKCRRLHKSLEHIGYAMALRRAFPQSDSSRGMGPSDQTEGDMYARHFYLSSKMDAEELEGYPHVRRADVERHIPFRAFLADETIPRMWAASAAAKAELPDLLPEQVIATSLARSIQDPYLELCHCLSPSGVELARLPLHPLMSELPEIQLRRALTAELVDATCRHGFNIFDALAHEHRAQALQFVPGLGPRKAAALLAALHARRATADRAIQSRHDLRVLLGPCVWHNAAGFINFTPPAPYAEPREPPGLDGTRIHPESYVFARKIAFDATAPDNEEIAETPATLESAIYNAMGKPEVLAQLEIEDYAAFLEEQTGRNKLPTLLAIREELSNPFADLRGDWKSLWTHGPCTPDRLFELLTSETDRTLHGDDILAGVKGTLAQAKVIRWDRGRQDSSGRLVVELQCGLPGYIHEDCISDKWTRVPTAPSGPDGRFTEAQLPVTPGQMISVKITSVNKSEFYVNAACKGTALKDAEYKTIAQEEAEAAAVARRAVDGRTKNAAAFVKRRIGHPQFKNGTAEQIASFLSTAPTGECIFRPSSKGPTHLTATLKTPMGGSLLHIDIEEEGKPSPAELGAALWIGRLPKAEKSGDKFDDLDEILARYVTPLTEHMEELVSHRKYRPDLEREPIETDLARQKGEDPKLIPYAFSPHPKFPAYAILSYMPKVDKPAIKEYVKVTPTGFVLRERTFETVDLLLNWFKQNFSKAPPQGSRPPTSHVSGGAGWGGTGNAAPTLPQPTKVGGWGASGGGWSTGGGGSGSGSWGSGRGDGGRGSGGWGGTGGWDAFRQ